MLRMTETSRELEVGSLKNIELSSLNSQCTHDNEAPISVLVAETGAELSGFLRKDII